MSGADCGAPGSCCAHHPDAGTCICTQGLIHLPAALYNPAIIACPRCHPEAWPGGFPGVKAQPDTMFNHWLIPPSDVLVR